MKHAPQLGRPPLLSAVACFWFAAIAALPTSAQSSIWKGGTGNWNDNNWNGGVPTASSSVFIDGGKNVASTVTVNVNNTVGTNLTLDSDDTLAFDAIGALTLSGTVALNGTTNLDFGALALNGPSTNSGTLNIATNSVTIGGHTVILNIGVLDGSGTLNNSGTIQGSGSVGIAITNLGTISATDPSNPLALTANINNALGILSGAGATLLLDGAAVTGGSLSGQIGAQNGATLNGGTFQTASLTAGSTLGIQGSVTLGGFLTLGNGATLNGSGSLVAPLTGGLTLAPGATATLSVNVSGPGTGHVDGGASASSALVLSGATLSNVLLGGQFTAQNGSTFNNATIQSPASLTTGSTLNIQGTVNVNSSFLLADGSTLTGTGLLNVGPGGSLGVQSGATATLSVNVGGPLGQLVGGSSGTSALILDGITVGGGTLQGQFTAQNGAALTAGSIGFASLTAGSTLSIQGTVTINNGLSLGNNVTLNGTGTLSDNLDSQIGLQPGASATIHPNIMGAGAGFLNGGSFPNSLTLDGSTVSNNFLSGQFTTIHGVTLQNDTFIGVQLTANSALSVQGTLTNNGTLALAGGVTLSGPGAIVNNSGALIEGGGSISAAISNNGTIIANNPSSPLVLPGNVSGTGILDAFNSSTLVIGPTGVGAAGVNIVSGTLTGTGQITLIGAVSPEVFSTGTIVPGSATAPGTITINGGNFDQTAGAVVDFLLTGGHTGQYSVLNIIDGSFDSEAGGIIEADFASTFDPSADCGATFGVCDTFDVVNLINGDIQVGGLAGISGLVFDLPALPTGFQWAELDLNNNTELALEILGSSSNGGGGGGDGGSNPTPEPGNLALIGAGLLAAAFQVRKLRRSAR